MFLINKKKNTQENITKLLNLVTCKDCFKYKKNSNIIIPVNKNNIKEVLTKEEKTNKEYKREVPYSNDIYFYDNIYYFLSEILDVLDKYYLLNENLYGLFGTKIGKYDYQIDRGYISVIKEQINERFKKILNKNQDFKEIFTLNELLELTDDNVRNLILEYGSFIKEKILDKKEKITNWDIINQDFKYRFDIINVKKNIANEFNNVTELEKILEEKNYFLIYKLLKEFVNKSEIILEASDKTYVVDNKIDNLEFLDKIFDGISPNSKYYSNGLYINTINQTQEDFKLYYEIFFNILLNYKEELQDKELIKILNRNNNTGNQKNLIKEIKKLNEKRLNEVDKKHKNIAIFYKNEIPKMELEKTDILLDDNEISF